jgi:deoxyribodipyrimidine photo-lyase
MRRALRVQDHTPLWHAMQDAEEVLPVVFLRRERKYLVDSPRRRFITDALANLKTNVEARGGVLCVGDGDPEKELPALAAQLHVDGVYAATVYDPAAIRRDDKIAVSLKNAGIAWKNFTDCVIFDREHILSATGSPYRVFTPYKRAWLERINDVPRILPAVRSIKPPPFDARALQEAKARPSIPGKEDGGETTARLLLHKFLKNRIGSYRINRDFPGIDGTSHLSPHLAVGTISVRQVFWAAREARDNAGRLERESIDTFIGELIWREFYYQILANFPHVVERSFREEFNGIEWSKNKRHFEAWCEGRTGYPIVDAGMRQLNTEGRMHNRVRMIVASFLTKDLQIHWQWGEKYFMDKLIDADIASNNGGWQWTAGTGTDASPWFRIFNPVTQGEKFDPNGDYIRRYVSELKDLPASAIHKPWTLTSAGQKPSGFQVGADYPAPIVDHAEQRKVALALYRNAGRGGQR